MSCRLGGKTALITGGGKGIGRAICELFANEGAQITILDIDESSAKETLQLLKQGHHFTIKADVTKSDDVKRAFKNGLETFGKPFDVVVNNAGIIGSQKPVSDTDEEDFDKTIDVNLKGIFLVAKEYLNSVKNVEKDVRGVLVNVSSIVVKHGRPFLSGYASSKHGIVALTKTIANEFNTHRVRCNAVCPGTTESPLLAAFAPERLDVFRKSIPMGRFASPHEIAHGFLFLASDDSSYVHGACLEISGGR